MQSTEGGTSRGAGVGGGRMVRGHKKKVWALNGEEPKNGNERDYSEESHHTCSPL